jgi:hypothetical protein
MGGAGIMTNSPIQVIWESNQKYAYGDDRWIYVAEADNNSRFDRIIKPYKYELSLKGL